MMGKVIDARFKFEERRRVHFLCKLWRIEEGKEPGNWKSIGHCFIPCDENGNEINLDDLPPDEAEKIVKDIRETIDADC